MWALQRRPVGGGASRASCLRSAFAVSLVFVSVAVGAPTAAGQPLQLYLRADGSLACDSFAVPCTSGSLCPAGQVCGPIGATGASYCHHGPNSFLCCETLADCQVADGATGASAMGSCSPVGSGVTISGGDRVCVFATEPSGTTFCALDDQATMAACMTNGVGAGGRPVDDWGYGNCDASGTTNGSEARQGCDPCDPTSTPPDCSVVVPDGGVVDSGAPGLDGSIPVLDGATPADSGTSDGGRTTDGAADGARPPATSGDEPHDGFTFRGGGGCSCRANPSPRCGPVVLGLLAWLALRRLGRRLAPQAGQEGPKAEAPRIV